MDDIIIYVLKWIGVVLVAGFIGYIGRYLAMLLLDKVRKKPPEEKNSTIKTEDTSDKYKYKLEKKRLKAELKKLKKQKNNEK